MALLQHPPDGRIIPASISIRQPQSLVATASPRPANASAPPPACCEPASIQPHVPEALLHDIWQALQFDRANLETCTGEPIRILNPGALNPDAGPDFLNATVQSASLTWRGDVELHIHSSDWLRHGHQTDPRYNSTILHVALYRDDQSGKLRCENGALLPELILAPHLSTPLRRILRDLPRGQSATLPCSGYWSQVDAARRKAFIRSLGEERMAEKTRALADAFLQTPDLATLLYRKLMRGLGYSKNADAMEELSCRLPLRLIRSVESQVEREALFMGAAGLLPEPADYPPGDPAGADYCHMLKWHFSRLREAHAIKPMPALRWKLARLRPANFPPIRLAQAAALSGTLLRRDPIGQLRDALKEPAPSTRYKMLLAAEPHPFWKEHYHFKKRSKTHSSQIGRGRVNQLLVNAVAPVMLLDAQQRANEEQRLRVLQLVGKLPSGSDEILRLMRSAGATAGNALAAQGLHRLKRDFCDESRCLKCEVGRAMLNG